MVKGASRKRRLPAVGGEADNPPAALGTQMRQGSAYKLDRPEEIRGELIRNLLVAELFRRAEKSIACVADDIALRRLVGIEELDESATIKTDSFATTPYCEKIR